ncbi:MAG: hypothetical protein IPJ23_04110 [Ignavibacteriales bacterium]|nr:hypothetical protein [Ignavibacteriales bacterium]
MKFYRIITLTILFLYGCGGSGKVIIDELLHNSTFNSNDFLISKVSVYSPYIVSFPGYKYPKISETEFIKVVLNKAKEKLADVTNNSDIKIENRKAPDFFRGIKIIKGEGEQLLKVSKSDYLLIIQSVTIGNEITTKTQNIDPYPLPPGIKDARPNPNRSMENKNSTKNTTQTSIVYDIWDVKKGASVLTVEASVVLVDGINHKDPYLSIEKVTEAFINHIKGSEE